MGPKRSQKCSNTREPCTVYSEANFSFSEREKKIAYTENISLSDMDMLFIHLLITKLVASNCVNQYITLGTAQLQEMITDD